MNEIEEVKARLDIVEVIGQSVPLQKLGRTFKAPCPFHQEKTPSFIVSPDRQSWHCFGACSTGGDVISFVMKREGIDFPEALRILAARAGVKLPERKVSVEQDRERERLYAANEAAAEYFESLLRSDAGREALAYLESRGIDDTASRDFTLGYSANSWDTCRDYLLGKGFSERELLGAGLVIRGDNGLYDRFRNRLMFAVWDAKGRIIGFGARALDESTPKYLNTAQTGLFDKGGNLYAFHKAQEAIRSERTAVVVEGYMDVIAAHQHGYRNVVAQMGTALTERQYGHLKRMTDKVVLVLDADGAGQDAMHKVVVDVSATETVIEDKAAFKDHLLRGVGSFYVAALPSGKDPDELIRSDTNAWIAAIDGARPYVDFWIEHIAKTADLISPEGKRDAAKEMMRIVGVFDSDLDRVIRAHYLQKVSRLVQVPEIELAPLVRSGRNVRAAPKRLVTDSGPASSEDLLLAALLQYPRVPVPAELSPDILVDARSKRILELRMEHSDPDELKVAAGPELASYLERLVIWRLPISEEEQVRGVLEDCIRKLNRRQLQAEQQALAAQIAALQMEIGSQARDMSVQDDAPEASEELQMLIQRDMEIGQELHMRDREGRNNAVRSGVNG